jgi:lipopolysaccharide transport protein LptA
MWKINLVFCLLIICSKVLALPSDRKEKFMIQADKTIYHYKLNLTKFEGHVNAKQGTTHLCADRLTTRTNQRHQIEEAIAYGDHGLAHYWTTPQAGEAALHAKAHIIKYYPLSSDIILQHKVTVSQGKNSFQGELILYNKVKQTIAVPGSRTSRSVLIYQPDI